MKMILEYTSVPFCVFLVARSTNLCVYSTETDFARSFVNCEHPFHPISSCLYYTPCDSSQCLDIGHGNNNCRCYHCYRQVKFPLAPMGVLAPGSAQVRPSARLPIDTSGNFPAHMSAESPSNISPNPSEVISEVSEP